MKYTLVVFALISIPIWSPVGAQEAPEPTVEGNRLVWSEVSALSINVHKSDHSYIDSLPGDATSWTAQIPGSYYLVATNEDDWTQWPQSATVTVVDELDGTPVPVVDGNTLMWSAVPALAINIHRGDGSYLTSLPGDASTWMTPEPGDYYVVAVTEGDWTEWPRSETITVDDFLTDAPMPVVEENRLVWPPVSALAINVHRGDGSYIESLSGNSTSWTAPQAGSYYLVATNETDWTQWSRSETVVIGPTDTFSIFYSNWSGAAAAYYEPEIKALELPADIHETEFVDNLPFSSETIVTDIALTSGGNGTYSQTYDFFIALDMPYHRSSIATRSSQDGTVSWSGTEMFTGSSLYYGAVEHVFETISTIEGRTLVQQGIGTVTLRRGTWTDTANIVRYYYDFVLDLDSIDEERENTCPILHGTSYHSFERHIEHEELSEFTASRNSSEENWAWNHTVDGETSSGEAIETRTRLYCDFLFNLTN